MDVRYRLIDSNGQVIFSNLSESDIRIIPSLKGPSNKFISGRMRAGTMESDGYKVFAFSELKDHIKSSSVFKKEIKTILNSANRIREIIEESARETNRSTSRLIHNLTSINAHNIQEFYSLIPQENVSRKMGKQLAYVQSVVEDEPKEAAMVLLRMAKNNAAMKAEFAVFKKLFDSTPDLRPTNHNVHKVLMNIFYLFFPDFTDKNVRVVVGDREDRYLAYFDYESVHVALYHIIENSAKYIRPGSEMGVKICNHLGRSEIIFEMISTQIRPDEVDIIFEEGVSGDIAKKSGKSGNGIGMSRARKIIELNGGSLSVKPDPGTEEVVMGLSLIHI